MVCEVLQHCMARARVLIYCCCVVTHVLHAATLGCRKSKPHESVHGSATLHTPGAALDSRMTAAGRVQLSTAERRANTGSSSSSSSSRTQAAKWSPPAEKSDAPPPPPHLRSTLVLPHAPAGAFMAKGRAAASNTANCSSTPLFLVLCCAVLPMLLLADAAACRCCYYCCNLYYQRCNLGWLQKT
ncbi:hypothetical protein JKP88DRAFT_253536 [Tribonema minus]|uniref:Uncharacterized protein n=1 Tax=Tribonema minus TaxID=303371 RepID=A0A835Z634_9STRA|nr:hypothetical protein JKP88DRAFT_253536 [Tribonema minus]